MADLSDRVSTLEAQHDDHGKTHERDDEDRRDLLFRIDAVVASLGGIKPAIENVTEKVDGINARLDTMNGSVRTLYTSKADKTILEKACEDQAETDKIIVELKSNYKWIYVLGAFLALLLLAHLGLTVYSSTIAPKVINVGR